MKVDGLSIDRPGDAVGSAREIDHLAEVNVEGGVLDSECNGVGHHLDLQALLAGRGGKGLGVGGDAREFLHESIGAHRCEFARCDLAKGEEAGKEAVARTIETR
jgi:hypothetical protein